MAEEVKAEAAQPVAAAGLSAMAQAVGGVLLERVKSMVPCTCTNTESAVLPAKISAVWSKVRYWKLEELAPGIVQSTEWTDGAAGRVDSTVKVSYTNGA